MESQRGAPGASNRRIEGFDVARALAILGMILVNFRLAAAPDSHDPAWLDAALESLSGRAAALFVVLAGIGIALMSRRSQTDPASTRTTRWLLLRRAVFLFFVGLAYTPLWPADILKWYGLYLTGAAALITARTRNLWAWAAVLIIGASIYLLVFDYGAGWDFESLTYRDFWTAGGMLRHMFLNGFHPILPWLAFLIAGLALGRLDFRDQRRRRRLCLVALTVAVAAEVLARLAGSTVRNLMGLSPDADELLLFQTGPMPPTAWFMVAAGATALVVIVVCIELAERFNGARLTRVLVNTGQLALTLYVAHVVIGMGILESLGLLGNASLIVATGAALVFYVTGVIFANLVCSRFKRGPLEWLMRRVTG